MLLLFPKLLSDLITFLVLKYSIFIDSTLYFAPLGRTATSCKLIQAVREKREKKTCYLAHLKESVDSVSALFCGCYQFACVFTQAKP